MRVACGTDSISPHREKQAFGLLSFEGCSLTRYADFKLCTFVCNVVLQKLLREPCTNSTEKANGKVRKKNQRRLVTLRRFVDGKHYKMVNFFLSCYHRIIDSNRGN